MSHSVVRSLRFFGVLFVVAATGTACSVKGLKTGDTNDGGVDAGRRDGGKGDVRVADVSPVAGNSGGAGGFGGAGGITFSIPGGAGATTVSSLAGTTTSSGGAGGASSRTPDAGVRDAYQPDTRDAAGGTGGSTVKLDAYVPDANRADTRDAPLGGSGGSGGTGGSGGAGGSGSRDAWVPDAPLPDAYLPDAPIDTPLGGSGGSGGSGGTGGTSSSTSAPALHIYSFNAISGPNSGTEITVTAGKSVTFIWDVSGATTKEINHDVGMVTGGTKTITVPSPTVETPYTYTLTVTNSVNDASTTFDTAHADVKINVVPLAITSFAANPTAVESGAPTTLTAIFVAGTGGTANISGIPGVVGSGAATIVSPTEATMYTLTVSNRLADFVTADVWVNVLGLDAGPP